MAGGEKAKQKCVKISETPSLNEHAQMAMIKQVSNVFIEDVS